MTNSAVLPLTPTPYERLTTLLKRLKLNPFLSDCQTIEHRTTQAHWSYAPCLLALAAGAARRRDPARMARVLTEAQLPCGKAWSNFEFSHVPSLNPAAMSPFAQTADWLDAASNLLLFGASGTGKTHASIALGRALIALGKRVKGRC